MPEYPHRTFIEARNHLVQAGVELPHTALYTARTFLGEEVKIPSVLPQTVVWLTCFSAGWPSRGHYSLYVCESHDESSGRCNTCGREAKEE